MTEAEARDFFDRTPILPRCVRVLVQIGTKWHWTEMPVGQIWPQMLAFERQRPKGKGLKRYSDQSCERVTLDIMAADIRGDAHTVCVGALWLMFRRKNEKANAYEATKGLASAMDEHDAVWIIVTGNEVVALESLEFIIAAPHWNPSTPDPEINMTPKQVSCGIYGSRIRQGDPLH
jgi:hypothetical protein